MIKSWMSCLCFLLVHLVSIDANQHEFSAMIVSMFPSNNELEPFEEEQYSDHFIETLANRTKCLNFDDILTQLGFQDFERASPYPSYEPQGYDQMIARDQNCYVRFENPEARTAKDETIKYTLHSWTEDEAKKQNRSTAGVVFLTHVNPCGTCSTLDQLATYLKNPDLTSTVRKCGFYGFLPNPVGKHLALHCLEALSFRGACKFIWYYNTINSRELCGGVCIAHLRSPNNMPTGGTNFCKPYNEETDRHGCKNTINHGPACADFQYEESEYRLNSCLQCDECRSGPVFQKYAGRTRRDSGLERAIKRPPEQVANITHYYGIPYN